MSSNYRAAVQAIVASLTAAQPLRVVTRRYQDFAARSAADLARGIYTVLSGGVEGYNYEASDHWGGLDGPQQTELGTFTLTITGQIRLPENATGDQVEDAEFDMIAELERFADAGIEDDALKDLLLRRTVMSQQLECPFAWVFTEWRLRLFD